MTKLIDWPDLPTWVPGRVLLGSDGLDWRNVALRSYHYEGQDVIVPAMRDFMLVSYGRGVTPMQRRFDGRWRRETLGPGATSLLTRAQRAFWNWREPIEVTHVYLSGALVSEVAGEVLDCAVSEVALEDVLRVEDPVMTGVAQAIAQEARTRGLGGALYVDSLARALIVHLLRRYAVITRREPAAPVALGPAQARRIRDFIEAHLAERMDLPLLAAAVDMTPCLFARQFRRTFGQPPYAYVLARRIERAERLLAQTTMPIKQIASVCGFSDQAHMTRLFRRAHGAPPGEYRRRRS